MREIHLNLKVKAPDLRVIAFTGAGISVESGIAGFHFDPTGQWSDFSLMDATTRAFRHNPERFWRKLKPYRDTFMAAEPNAAHKAFVELEETGKLVGIVTTNIDGLHAKAGSKVPIAHLHGDLNYLRCPACGAHAPAELFEGVEIPECNACGSIMRPDITLVDEGTAHTERIVANELIHRSNVGIIVGMSGMGTGSEFVHLAKKSGMTLINVNPCENGYEKIADVNIEGKAGDIIPQLVEVIRNG